MATEIEALQLGIKVNSESANRKLDAFVKKINEIKSVLTGIDEDKMAALNMAMGSGVGATKPVQEIKKAADEGNTAMKTLKSSTTEVSDAAKSTGTSGAEEMEKITQTVQSTSTKMVSLKDGFKNLLSPLKKFGSLFSDIMRIAKYRMIRSVIKEITQGFSEGMKNLYEYSKSINGTFAKARDKVTTATTYLKNSIGAAFGGLYEMAAPVIDKIVDGVVEGLNYVNRMIAAISGKSTWTKAVKNLKEYNDEAKRTILGIDEINKLNGNENDNAMFDFKEVALTNEEMYDLNAQFRTILTTVGLIGTAILGWKLATPFLDSLNLLKALKIEAGVTLALGGVALAFAGGQNSTDWKGLLEGILGTVATGLGGVLIASAVGAAASTGFIIGIAVGVVAYLSSLKIKEDAQLKAKAEDTDLWKLLDSYQKKAEELSQAAQESKTNIKLLQDRLLETTDYDAELTLLDEIEKLNSKTNKTSEDLESIKTKIDTLNSYGSVGEGLKFNEFTGQIEGSIDAVRTLIQELKNEAQLEGYLEIQKELYKEQANSTLNASIAYANLQAAEEAKQKIIDTKQSVSDQIDELNKKASKLGGSAYLSDEDYEKWEALTDVYALLQVELDKANEVVKESKTAYSETNEALKDTEKTIDAVEEAIAELSEGNSVSVEKMADLLGVSKDTTEKISDLDTSVNKILEPLEDFGLRFDTAKESAKKAGSAVSTYTGKLRVLSGVMSDFDKLTWTAWTVSPFIKSKAKPNPNGYLPRLFANGGFPSQGSMFIANESGAEMVGTIGNRTAVANTGDITTAISDAVYQAFSSAGGNGGSITIQMMDESGNVRSEKYISAAQKRNLRDGKITLPVGV